MTFDDEDIKKYQALSKEYFNEEVDEPTAVEEMNSLMFMVNLIYHPYIKQRLKEEASAKPLLQFKPGQDQPQEQ